jgi:uncharacterized protein (TIGR00251 family)
MGFTGTSSGGCHTVKESVHIEIKAFPGSSKNEFAGVKDSRLRVRIAAPPEDGKANACLLGFLAKTLGCSKKDVVLVKGEKSRLKTIAVPAEYAEKVRDLFKGNSTEH